MNPFITLTRINRGGKVYINVNHIVAFHQKTFPIRLKSTHTFLSLEVLVAAERSRKHPKQSLK